MGRITSSRKQLKPDPVYGSLLASKFINTLMHDGKKSVAQNVFYDALDLVKKRIPDKEPIEVFTQAVEHVTPSLAAASQPPPPGSAGDPLDPAGDPRKEGSSDGPEAGRRIRRRLQPRRHGR